LATELRQPGSLTRKRNRFTLRRLPLGPALVVAFVMVALVPALLVAWLLTSNSAQSINTLAENAMSQAAHRVDVGAIAHLGEAHTVVNALLPPFEAKGAEADRTRRWLTDPASFEEMAYALTQQSPNVPYLYFGTEDGTFFGLEREDRGFVVRQIRPGESGRSHYLIAQPGDRDHRFRVEDKVYDPRVRPWYQKAASQGKRIFTDVYRSAVKDQFDLTLAQPIYAKNGKHLLGVMAVDMSLARLTDLIRSTRISANAVTYLVDGHGLMVASSGEEALSALVDGKQQRISPSQSTDPLIKASYALLSTHAPGAGDTRTLEPEAVHLDMQPSWRQKLGFESNRLIALQRPFGQQFELQWQLIVVAPENDFASQVLQARQWALAAIAGLIGLCGLIAFAVARGLSGQFRQLNASATAVGAGQIPPVQDRAPLREVHHLSQVMHDSAAKLQTYTQEIQLKNEQLRDAAQLLEERVRVRTAELADSREEALAAVKAKAGFLAVMSHEIRTPLNGVVGMGELLNDTALTESQKDLLGVLKVSSRQLLSVVDDILDFSKIESGHLELEHLPLDLHGAIHDVTRIVSIKAAEKGLHLDVQIAPEVPIAVVGDITRLRQVLLNLLSNAIKFTAAGKVSLRVWVEHPVSDGVLGFAVTDTGVGIEPSSMAALFQPFSQGDTSTARVYGGTGLGLMICKHLVALMGGEISVTSQPGQGSSFRFTVRTEAATLDQVTPPPDVEIAHQPQAQRVLVVDDNLVNLKVASAMLQRLGYPHDTATDGLLALKAISRADQAGQPYAIVLLDSHMPRMDGMATSREILARYPQAPPVIIGVSASSLGEDRQRCLDAGMSAYLVKPLELRTLHDVLAQYRATFSTSSDLSEAAAHAPSNAADSTLMAQAPLVDPVRWHFLTELDEDGGKLRQELVNGFFEALASRAAHFDQTGSNGTTAAQLRETAHFLKGSATNVGAARLGQICDALERSAAAGHIDNQAIELFARTVEPTREAFDRLQDHA
jgi:signal transduction histidine kinase/CheY-like chemotaxis protein/HPt (histidine-containing phosphotransfer) domain-containing protein